MQMKLYMLPPKSLKKKETMVFYGAFFDLHESQSFSRYIKIIKLIKYIPRVFLLD